MIASGEPDLRRLHPPRRHLDLARAHRPGDGARAQPRRPRRLELRGDARLQPRRRLPDRGLRPARDRRRAHRGRRRLADPAVHERPRGRPRARPLLRCSAGSSRAPLAARAGGDRSPPSRRSSSATCNGAGSRRSRRRCCSRSPRLLAVRLAQVRGGGAGPPRFRAGTAARARRRRPARGAERGRRTLAAAGAARRSRDRVAAERRGREAIRRALAAAALDRRCSRCPRSSPARSCPPTSSPLTSDTAQGNLFEPLGAVRLAGIWPAGDFRAGPVDEIAAYALIVVVDRRRRRRSRPRRRGGGARPLLVYAVGTLVAATVILVLGSPWVDGKAMATAAPAVLMLAAGGRARARRARHGLVRRLVGAVAARRRSSPGSPGRTRSPTATPASPHTTSSPSSSGSASSSPARGRP